MRFTEVLSLAEALASTVVKIARARHQQILEAEPDAPQSVATVAGEVLRLVETRVGVELADEGGERRG